MEGVLLLARVDGVLVAGAVGGGSASSSDFFLFVGVFSLVNPVTGVTEAERCPLLFLPRCATRGANSHEAGCRSIWGAGVGRCSARARAGWRGGVWRP